MAELIYHGERSDVIDYLTGHGWDVTAQKMPDAYAANGFEFPEDGAMGFFADMSYVSAVKRYAQQRPAQLEPVAVEVVEPHELVVRAAADLPDVDSSVDQGTPRLHRGRRS